MDDLLTRMSEVERALTKVNDELVELYKRTNLLLKLDEEAQNTIGKLKTAQEQLVTSVNHVTTTLEHMKH